MWSGVPVIAVILAVTLSPDSCLRELAHCPSKGPSCIYGGLYTAAPPGPPMSSGPAALAVVCVCCLVSFPLTTPLLLEGRLTPVSWGGQLARVHEVRCPLLLSEVPGGLGTCQWGGGSSRTSPDSAVSSPEDKWPDLIDQSYERIDYLDSFWASVSWKQPNLRFDYFNHQKSFGCK